MGAAPSISMVPPRNIESELSDLEMKILKIFAIMRNRQQKVQDKYNDSSSSKEFHQYSLANMNTYVKIADMIATDMADPELINLMEDCKDIWLNKVYPELCDNPNLLRSDDCKLASFPKILAGVSFIFGNHYLGLTYLITSLRIQPNDMVVYAAVLKWACILGEFDVVKMYAKNHRFPQNRQDALADFICVCRHFCDFFDSSPLSHADVNEKLDSLMIVDKKFLSLECAPLQSFYGRQLIHKIFSIAALMPNADVRKYNDYNYHMKMSTECSLSVLLANNEKFMEVETMIPLFHHTDISGSEAFLIDALALTDVCVTEMAYCQALIESGCINNCESRVICAFTIGTKIAVSPLRILEPLNMLHYIKLRTANDHDKLKGIRAITSLLLGRVFEDQNRTIISPFRLKLLEENHSFEVQTADQSFTNKSPVSNTIPFSKHQEYCTCFICFEIMHNSNFFVQKRYSNLLLDNLSLIACKNNIDKIRSSGGILLQKEQTLLYKTLFIDNKSFNNFFCRLPLITNVCIIICNCLLINPDMPEHEKTLLCNMVIRNANIFPLHLRSYWLLARQLKRKCEYLHRFPWLNESENNETVRYGEDIERFDNIRYEAANDFILFEHIFFLDWRRRICLYLGVELLEDDPWQSAFYFIESLGTSLREYLRIKNQSPLDLRLDNPEALKGEVQNFPGDFTYIQLVLDDSDVVWLIRCSANFAPIVLPITRFENGNIPERFLKILVDNDNSMKKYDAPDYWEVRESMEKKMEELVLDVEKVWFGFLKCLLLPFGDINSQRLANIVMEVRDVLREIGLHGFRAKFLAMLFFHADYHDWFFVFRVFCFLQRDTLKFCTQEVFENLVNEFSQYRDSFERYLKKDKYIVLAVSQELSSYPWESLPVIKCNTIITRIQTLHFFVRLLIKSQRKVPFYVNTEKSYCVIEAGNENLSSTLIRMSNELNVNSFLEAECLTPEQYQFLNFIGKCDIFLFIGHGYGGTNGFALRNSKCRAVPILMGCSSVRIKDEGRGFDGEAVVHDYIIAGAPSVIGCLWMVSDGELDKFLIKFIELCIPEWSNRINSFTFKCKVSKDDATVRTYPLRLMMKALVEARKACRLPLLTGAAVVAYGFPVMADPAPLEEYFNSREININTESNNN